MEANIVRGFEELNFEYTCDNDDNQFQTLFFQNVAYVHGSCKRNRAYPSGGVLVQQ